MVSYTFLGINVNPLIADDLFPLVKNAIENEEKVIIANHNLHSTYLLHHNDQMRKFYEKANFTYIDGMPLVWIGRLIGYPLKAKNRFTTIDWLDSFLTKCNENGLRVYFLGSEDGVVKNVVNKLKERFSSIEIEGHHGYFNISPNSSDNHLVISEINNFKPHILLVGMGMPRQENWIIQNYDRLNFNVVLNLGAFMELLSGSLPTPPRIIGSLGLEGIYRLLTRPNRVWYRYLIEPWFILRLMIIERLNYYFQHLFKDKIESNLLKKEDN